MAKIHESQNQSSAPELLDRAGQSRIIKIGQFNVIMICCQRGEKNEKLNAQLTSGATIYLFILRNLKFSALHTLRSEPTRSENLDFLFIYLFFIYFYNRKILRATRTICPRNPAHDNVYRRCYTSAN